MPVAIALAIAAAVAAVPGSALAAEGDASPLLLGRGVPGEDRTAAEPAPVRPGGTFVVCPVDRPRRYRDDFGEPRWGGGFHRHQGIDIFAGRGTPVRAPFDGDANSSVSWAGGLQVYVYGNRGFVFNGHLDRVGTMGKVKAGDIIGWVGNSGDAQGGSTHDHFEWHPHDGAAVDSFYLLNQACHGAAGSGQKAQPERPPAVLRDPL